MFDRRRPDWQQSAACRGEPNAVFFQADSSHHDHPARAICDDCPVREQCRDFAMADPSLKGVWGGTTERDRKRLRKHQRAGWQRPTTPD